MEAAETAKLQHLSKRHAEEVKKLMAERDEEVKKMKYVGEEQMRLLCDAHDEKIKHVTDTLEVGHKKALEDMRVALLSQSEAREKKFAVQLSEVTAQVRPCNPPTNCLVPPMK